MGRRTKPVLAALAVLPVASVLSAFPAASADAYGGAHEGRPTSDGDRGRATPATALTATLSDAQEVPAAGDPDGRGLATLGVQAREGRLCAVLSTDATGPATAAHVHRGAPGTAGPIVVALPVPAADSGFVSQCVAADKALLADIARNPADFYVNIHTREHPGGAVRGQLARGAQGSAGPDLTIVSPARGDRVAPGAGTPGVGSVDGSGFVINLEVQTRDQVPVKVKEATTIRHAELLGQANPDFPGLEVRVDTDLVKPDGGLIPAGTNLAALFNVAGVDDTQGPGVTVWAGWHMLESLPPRVSSFLLSSSVRDEAGRTSSDAVRVAVDRGVASGQALTPAPGPVALVGQADRSGPKVSLSAPRTPSAVATGPVGTPVPPAGSLLFLQVDALDRRNAGIGVSEAGPGNGPGQVGTPGSILDAGQIATGGHNRNYPGLVVTFDAALRQPNGNLVPAGQNLAPLFNIAGSEHARDHVRTTADWVVGGSLELPADQRTLTVTAAVTDATGHTGSDRITLRVSETADGQRLTFTP